MSIELAQVALAAGFVNGPGGTHTSRTIMLTELQAVLAACPASADYVIYQQAILDENVLFKNTASTRRRSLRALRELYALDRTIILFRALRDLWAGAEGSRPLLALLCAVARDPLLRATSESILKLEAGQEVTPKLLEVAVNEQYAKRYNPSVLAKIGRNAASSWQQSGHLRGRREKIRQPVQPTVEATAYALLLGYLCGVRGEALFQTRWARLLDAPVHQLRDQAFMASQQGLLEYRHTGAVTEITFRYLLRTEGATTDS